MPNIGKWKLEHKPPSLGNLVEEVTPKMSWLSFEKKPPSSSIGVNWTKGALAFLKIVLSETFCLLAFDYSN